MNGDRINEKLKQPLTSDAGTKRDLTKILLTQLEKQDLPKLGAAAEGLKSPVSTELAETSLDDKIDKIVAKFDENRRSFENFGLEYIESLGKIKGVKSDFAGRVKDLEVSLSARNRILKEYKRKFGKIVSEFIEVKSRFENIKQSNLEGIKASFFESTKEEEQIKATRDSQQESNLKSPASPEFARNAWDQMQARITRFRANPVRINKSNIDNQNQNFEDALKDLSIHTHRDDMFDGKASWINEVVSSNFKRVVELEENLEDVFDSSRRILEDSKKLLEQYSEFVQRYNSAHREPSRLLTLEDFWF